MFDVLREKLQSVQGNLTASFKVLSVSEEGISNVKNPHLDKLNLYAGVDVLEKFQSSWSEIHSQTVDNAKEAQAVDDLIGCLHRRLENQWRNIGQVSVVLSRLPEVTHEVDVLTETLGSLNELFIDVEKALANLGDLIERRELQEKQLDHRFQLALYKEKKLSQLENTRVTLAQEHAQKVALHEARQHRVQRERQEAFEQQFKQDVDIYKETNKVPKMTRNAENSPGSKLEEVELDNDEDKGAFDEFLHESTPEPQTDE